MKQALDRTCWRGMQIDHPAEWELCYASGAQEPGRCTFADRTFQRLDVRWKPITYVPNLDMMLDRYRQKQADVSVQPVDGCPPEWRGVVRNSKQATVTHAGRYFPDPRLLVELTLVWPARRNEQLERRILEGVAAADPKADPQTWRAMGIHLAIGEAWELRTHSTKVGRVRWEFASGPKEQRTLAVERIAMPEHWLKGSLANWLQRELPMDTTAIKDEPREFAGHAAHQLLSRERLGTFNRLRGRRRLRVDMAWQCDIERRVYRLTMTETVRSETLSLPPDLTVWCCRHG